MGEPGAAEDERWSRLYAEMRENQRRAAAAPRPRVPFVAIYAAGFLLSIQLVHVPVVWSTLTAIFSWLD